ncbi:MAG: type II secretion system protein [Candidatus Omnitrophica bacterium]|nr:type II secretion system protein [Candidatus Omnitrophota bacterium]
MKTLPQNRLSERGSILLESLAAVVILSVSVVTILQPVTAALKAQAKAGQRIETSLIFENQLAELALAPQAFLNKGDTLIENSAGGGVFKTAVASSPWDESGSLKVIHFILTKNTGSLSEETRITTLYATQDQK